MRSAVLWILGWTLAIAGAFMLFCATQGCRGVESEEEANKRSLCVSEWLRTASEAPSCQQALYQLSEFVKSDPRCLSILGPPDAHGLLSITCEEAKRR